MERATIRELSEAVIGELERLGYASETIKFYQRLYRKLRSATIFYSNFFRDDPLILAFSYELSPSGFFTLFSPGCRPPPGP